MKLDKFATSRGLAISHLLYSIRHNWLYTLLCLVLLAGYQAQAQSAEAVAKREGRYISVTGQGKIEVVPDEVRFVVGVDAKQPTASQAYEVVERKMKQALEILRAQGVKRRDIQAMHINLNPIIDYKQRDRIIAHDARRDIHIKVDDMQTYARIIEKLAEIDITRFQQVQLASSKKEQLKIQALELAYGNAEAKARALAARAGQKLAGAVEITEGGAPIGPRPVPFARAAVSAMADESAAGASVAAGLITVHSQLSVVFELQ